MADPSCPDPPSRFHRFVGARAGELSPGLWCAAYFFCVLCSYSCLRPLRETAGIEGGVERLPMLFLFTMLAMLMVNPVFALLVSVAPRRVFIPITYGACMACLAAFAVLYATLSGDALAMAGRVFYVWLSVFNLFAVSVFWALMVDVWRLRQGRRLFGFIGVGGTLGAIAGPAMTKALTDARVEPWVLFVASGCLLGAAGGIALRIMVLAGVGRSRPGTESSTIRAGAEPGRRTLRGIVLLARSPYLLGIGAYVLLFTILGTMLYFLQGALVAASFESRDDRTSFFALLDVTAQSITLLVQVFLTGRLIRWIGVGWALAVQPLLMLCGFLVLGLVLDGSGSGAAPPALALWTFFGVQALQRGLNYGLAKPARELLFTAVSQPEKYGSKPIIDTFVYRTGDAIGALGYPALTKGLTAPFVLAGAGLSLAALSFAMAPVAALWAMVGVAMGVAHRRRTGDDSA